MYFSTGTKYGTVTDWFSVFNICKHPSQNSSCHFCWK